MTSIFCTFQVPGFHCWKAAPDDSGYLRDMHRHVFHVRVECRVQHDDRDTEFIYFKQFAKSHFEALGARTDLGVKFGEQSCEMLANALRKRLCGCGHLVTRIEVSEDAENGSIVTID